MATKMLISTYTSVSDKRHDSSRLDTNKHMHKISETHSTIIQSRY